MCGHQRKVERNAGQRCTGWTAAMETYSYVFNAERVLPLTNIGHKMNVTVLQNQ